MIVTEHTDDYQPARDQKPETRADVDYYPSHEALRELVSLWSEHVALNGGGPGWAGRWESALNIATDLVRIEP